MDPVGERIIFQLTATGQGVEQDAQRKGPTVFCFPFICSSARSQAARVSVDLRYANLQRSFIVGRPGLEPGTLGLKVPCSTR